MELHTLTLAAHSYVCTLACLGKTLDILCLMILLFLLFLLYEFSVLQQLRGRTRPDNMTVILCGYY